MDPDPKAKKLIDFTGNLGRDKNATMFFIIEEAKGTRNSEGIVNLFCFNIISII